MLKSRMVVGGPVVLVVLLLAASTVCAEKVLLRCKYKAGDKYLATMVSDQDISQELPERTNKMSQVMRMEMGMDVLSVDGEGTAEVKVTYRRIALKQDSQFYRLDYDSADPEKSKATHPALVGFKGLVGKSLTLTMSSRGEIKGVKGLNELMEAVLQEIPEGQGREQARAQLAQTMNDERFSQQMSAFSLLFPEEPVGVGDTWRREQKMNMGFLSFTVRTNYTVQDVAHADVRLGVESTIEPGGEPDEKMPMTIALEEGKQSGTTKVNRANAILVESNIAQTMKMNIGIQGQTIKQQVTGKATITVKPDAGQ